MAESVAETFLLIATDDISARRRVRRELLGFGVAGGVLADLALRRFLRIDEAGLVRPTSTCGGGPPGSAAAHVVAAVAQRTGTVPVPVRWVEELGPTVLELVSRELADAEAPGPEPGAPRRELARMLREPRRFTLAYGLVAVLVDAVGLAGTFSADLNEAVVREILGELVDHLPSDLRAITQGVRAAAAHPAAARQR